MLPLPALLKRAELLPDVTLQDHQQALADESKVSPVRKLLVHALGSGKSLSSLAMAEAQGGDYAAVVPAALRENYKGEAKKFTTSTPEVLSYTELGRGKRPKSPIQSLIGDEIHRLRNPNTAASKAFSEVAQKTPQVALLSGTPIINHPSDLAVPMSILTGDKITPKDFTNRYVDKQPVYANLIDRVMGDPSGHNYDVKNRDELKQLLEGKVDWYEPSTPLVATRQEDVNVDMSDEQHMLYKAMWDKLPFYLKWKLQNHVDLTDEEMARSVSFLTGPRQAGLSIFPYMSKPDPHKAFAASPKLTTAKQRLMEELKNEKSKALVFSNFIDAGLTPYAAALQKENIPHAVFSGKLSDAERKKLVDDYNADKLKVALLGPSGTEGLSFKGTRLIQLLDPHFQGVRPQQAIGRGVRFGSHDHLPEDMRDVRIERYASRLPKGTFDWLLGGIGLDREHKQHATDDNLRRMSERKEELNRKFLDLLKEVGSRPQQEVS